MKFATVPVALFCVMLYMFHPSLCPTRVFNRPYIYECLAVIYFKKKEYDKARLLIQAAIDLKHSQLNRFKGQLKRFKEHLKKSEK